MNQKTRWIWQFKSPMGEHHGHLKACDVRDAVSRALTSQLECGSLLGNKYSIPLEVIDAAPGNADKGFEFTGDRFSIRVRQVTCPTRERHGGDIVGCGSSDVDGPDDEGLYDCLNCGLFFNALEAY